MQRHVLLAANAVAQDHDWRPRRALRRRALSTQATSSPLCAPQVPSTVIQSWNSYKDAMLCTLGRYSQASRRVPSLAGKWTVLRV